MEMTLLSSIESKSKRETITSLIQDTNALRVMVLRLENQILRNEAMIENLMAMREESANGINDTAPAPASSDKLPDNLPRFSQMVESVIPDLPDRFTTGEIVSKVFHKFNLAQVPKLTEKHAKQNLYQAIYNARSKGIIKQGNDGFYERNNHIVTEG